jgi:hypothetical protein
MILLAIALTVQKIRSPDKDREKPPADAASGRAEVPKPSRFRPTSGSELGSRERRKPRPTQADLPDDPSQIKELTPEQAKLLVAKFKGGRLDLSGLTTLDAETAKVLAEFEGNYLILTGLTTLDADTANALAEYKGQFLTLNGLAALDADTAKALAEFKGYGLDLNGLTTLDAETAQVLAEAKGDSLSLAGLTTLDADTAKALAEFKGAYVSLRGLTTLDADTAQVLAEFKGKLNLDGLTTLDADTANVLRETKGRLNLRQDIRITSKTRISKRPSKPKPTPTPVAPAAAIQPPTSAWLGIIGAVVLLVCYRIWRKRSSAAKEQVNGLKRKERIRRVPPR